MRRTTPLATLALTASLVLAGCGTSGGDGAGTGSGGEGGAGTPADVTTAQLEEILPTAEDIGPDYVLDEIDSSGAEDDADEDGTDDTTEDETDDSMDAAMDEACPEAAELDWADGIGEDGDEVTASFSTEDGRSLEVGLSLGAPITEEQVDAMVDALSSCTEIEIEEDGTAMTMDLSAEKTEGLGDYGMQIAYSFSFDFFGVPFEMSVAGNAFVVDGVGVTVMASSGMDEASMEPIPEDADLVDPLSEEMQGRVEALTD